MLNEKLFTWSLYKVWTKLCLYMVILDIFLNFIYVHLEYKLLTTNLILMRDFPNVDWHSYVEFVNWSRLARNGRMLKAPPLVSLDLHLSII